MGEGELKKSEFPTDPYLRSLMRWIWLFDGTLRALIKWDPKLLPLLLESYKKFGLMDEMFGWGLPFFGDLFRPNLTDQVLKKLKNFRICFSPQYEGEENKVV